MKTKLLLFVLFMIPLLFPYKIVRGEKSVEVNPALTEVSAKKLDNEAKILANYLSKYDSPLEYHAQDFIDAAKQYDLDWKLLPSIAGVESTFGKQIPGGYNGWGWGVYGNQAIYFDSWKEAIFTVAQGLRENYFNKGLTEPYSINRIYAASPHWGYKVTYFMDDLEKFANNFEVTYQSNNSIGQTPKIAAVSGQPTLPSPGGPAF